MRFPKERGEKTDETGETQVTTKTEDTVKPEKTAKTEETAKLEEPEETQVGTIKKALPKLIKKKHDHDIPIDPVDITEEEAANNHNLPIVP